MRIQSCLAVVVTVVCVTLPNVSWAKSSLDTRLERVENIIDNQVSSDMQQQLEAAQEEVRELRGKLEEQRHEMELMAQKQEKLFLNLDSRIGSLSKNATAAGSSILPPEPEAEAAPTVVDTTPVNPNELPDTNAQVHASDAIWRLTESNEKKCYEDAYKLMNARTYPDALIAFQGYLNQYPDGTYAANSYYWIGEVYAAQWHANRNDNVLINNALTAFHTVVQRFPQHHKAADALLKLGIVEADLQNWDAAAGYLNQVILTYPNTAGAQIAVNKLQAIQDNLAGQ